MLSRINNGNSTYAVYDLNGIISEIDKVSVEMINNNQNENIGLAPIRFDSLNGTTTKMIFDITGKISLREYISKNISQSMFRDMLFNLIESIEGFDEYMIDPKRVLFDIDSVFINEVDLSVAFICIAQKQFEQEILLSEFFRSVITNSRVIVNDGKNDYFHYAWNVISNPKGFSLKNLKTVLKQAEKSEAKPSQADIPVQTQQGADVPSKPINEQGDVTVKSNSLSYQQQAMPVMPAKPEKKGLFSRHKNKKKESPDTYKGGLAGLKNMTANQPQMPATPQAEAPQPAQTASFAQPNLQSMESSNNEVFGTTVIRREMPVQPQTETAKPVIRTKVPDVRAAQPAVSPSKADFGGTTVISQNRFETETRESSPYVQPAASNAPESAVYSQPVVGTTVIQRPSVQQPDREAWIIRVKTNERIMLNKEVIRIGRDRPDVDYCVNDNTNVGHLHASIFVRENGYFIVDHNSKNHTFINGEAIVSGSETRLMNNSLIKLADEEFKFVFRLN